LLLALNTYLLDQQLCFCFVTYSSQKCQSSYIVTLCCILSKPTKINTLQQLLTRCKVYLKHEESSKKYLFNQNQMQLTDYWLMLKKYTSAIKFVGVSKKTPFVCTPSKTSKTVLISWKGLLTFSYNFKRLNWKYVFIFYVCSIITLYKMYKWHYLLHIS